MEYIDRFFKDLEKDQKREYVYALSGRKVLCSLVKEDYTRDKKERLILYRKGGRYFLAHNEKPIAVADTRTDCAKKAFLDGYLDGEQYHFFSAGKKAADDYVRNQRNKERLMR